MAPMLAPQHSGPSVFNPKDLNQYDFPSSDEEPFSQVFKTVKYSLYLALKNKINKKLWLFSYKQFLFMLFLVWNITIWSIFLVTDLIIIVFYRSIQVPRRQRRRMTQMAATRSGERLAVSITL